MPGAARRCELRIEVPVEDMARLDEPVEIPSGPAAQGPVRPSIWSGIHPRLLELVRAHRSTLVFVNSRRLAERLAAALNDLADEVIAYAHHGSIAREQRVEIEDRLKRGQVRALVATSSLELGIDMGAIDLVVQIEAPPSVASGLQRIGRGGHQVGAPSRGVLFPKYRADLVACAALTQAMRAGNVEVTRYPRNPLDVLAQQIVAMVSMEPWGVDDLFAAVRRAAPFAELSRPIFDGVLDMLSGRYASDDFAALRPRVTWDRVNGAARGARGRPSHRRHQRRHHPRSRPLRRVPRRRAEGPGAGGRARRGDGLREQARRHVPARRIHLAHRGDHPRPRAGDARSGRARAHAVLARRRGGPLRRARPPDRRAGARAAPAAAGRRAGAPRARARPRPARRGEPAPLPRRPARGRRAWCRTSARW